VDEPPEWAIVLGSGLGALVDSLERPRRVPFTALPGLPAAGVPGHEGAFVAGRLSGRPVLLQAGRFHLYEGHSIERVVAPIRLAAGVGARRLLLTNAAGGVDPTLEPGDLVRLVDHVSLLFREPPGPPEEAPGGTPWHPGMGTAVDAVAHRLGIPLRAGVYAAVKGPSYETPAEVGMLRRMGADVVGMSTVPEALAGARAGMECVGLSLVTNRAAGLSALPLRHEEVLEVGRLAAGRLVRLVEALVGSVPPPAQSTGAK